MPGYIHGLIQVEFSILVKDGVRTGRERGMSEGAGLPYSHRLLGQPPASSPLTPVSWEQDQLWLDPPPPKLNKSASGFLEGTPVSFLATSLNDHREFIFLSLSSSVKRHGWASELCPPATLVH